MRIYTTPIIRKRHVYSCTYVGLRHRSETRSHMWGSDSFAYVYSRIYVVLPSFARAEPHRSMGSSIGAGLAA